MKRLVSIFLVILFSGFSLTLFACVAKPIEFEVALIASGANHSFFIDTDGNLWGCGRNDYGQLGAGSIWDKKTPILINTKGRMNNAKIAYITTCSDHSLAIDVDGNLWGFGSNWFGRLGDGSKDDSREPVLINTDGRMDNAKVVKVSTSGGHTLAIDEQGNLWSWGLNDSGQLGSGTIGDDDEYGIPTPTLVNTDGRMDNQKAVRVAAGGLYSMAIDEQGDLWAWGLDYNFQESAEPTPIRINVDGVLGNAKIVDIAIGNCNLVLDAHGNLWSWGANESGQLGDGTRTERAQPMIVNTAERMNNAKVASISVDSHCLVIDTDGNLWGWGWNLYGQVGDGTNNNSILEPVQINTDGRMNDCKITQASAGGVHSLAIDENGTVWAWGDNYVGQFGNGTRQSKNRDPIQITKQKQS